MAVRNLCIFFLLVSAYAVVPRDAYGTPYSLRVDARGLRPSEALHPILVKGRVAGFGAFGALLAERKVPEWPAEITNEAGLFADSLRSRLLTGSARLNRRGEYPASAAILPSGGGFTLRVTLFGPHARRPDRDRLLHLRIALDSAGNIVSARAQRRTLREGDWCGNRKSATLRRPALRYERAASQSPRIADISTDADPEFAKAFGGRANAEIAAIINDIEPIYVRTFNIRFNIVSQHVFESNQPARYNTRDSLKLIYGFQEYASVQQHLGSADIYHLFTGKEIADGILGRGFEGVVCANSSYAYAFSRYTNPSTTIITVAHEIGHNFGAAHSEGGVMAASARDSSNKFKAQSKQEIDRHLSLYSGCLEDADSADPLPAGAQLDITVKRKNKKKFIKAVLTDANGLPLSGYPLMLVRDGAGIKTKTSNGSGAAQFRVKMPGSYQVIADPAGASPLVSEALLVGRRLSHG